MLQRPINYGYDINPCPPCYFRHGKDDDCAQCDIGREPIEEETESERSSGIIEVHEQGPEAPELPYGEEEEEDPDVYWPEEPDFGVDESYTACEMTGL